MYLLKTMQLSQFIVIIEGNNYTATRILFFGDIEEDGEPDTPVTCDTTQGATVPEDIQRRYPMAVKMPLPQVLQDPAGVDTFGG